jgi:hypothetical protein
MSLFEDLEEAFGVKKTKQVRLDREEGRRATDYKFKPSVTHQEASKDILRLIKSIDEVDGLQLSENNKRLFTVVLAVLAEIQRLRDAGDETVQFAKRNGEYDKEAAQGIEAMVRVSQIAEISYIINAYATGEFILGDD